MAITYRSSSTAANAGATSLTITAPASIAECDIMIAIINVNTSATVITPPAGWTLLNSVTDTFSANMSTYWKRARSESGNYQWGFDTSQRSAGAISVFVGVDNSKPINANGGQSTAAGGNATAPSITATVGGCALVYCGGDDSTTVATWTAPSGMTESADCNSAQTCEIAYLLSTTSGATGTKTGVCTNVADPKGAFLIALNPFLGGAGIFF